MARRIIVKMRTASEARRAIARIVNLVLNNELEPRQANCALYGLNLALSAIRADEIQKQILDLERRVEQGGDSR